MDVPAWWTDGPEEPSIREQYAQAGITQIDTPSEMMDASGARVEGHYPLSNGVCHFCGEQATPYACAWAMFYFLPDSPTPCEAKGCWGCSICDAGIGFGDY